MAELTAQQIEFAVAAFENVAGHAATGELLSMAERMRRAAPFLQLPWDEPSREERNVAANQRNVELALLVFVRRRNAAIQPKPVDPLREKIIAALDKLYLNKESSKIADAILDALDRDRLLSEPSAIEGVK